MASSQERIKAMVTTRAMSPVNSPTADFASRMGRKAAEVVSEEVSKGTSISLPVATAAAIFFSPRSRRTRIPSAMTIPLSTRSPREIIRAARDILLMPTSNHCMTTKVMAITEGMSAATTTPVRSPRNASMTINTIATACRRFFIKSSILRPTIRGWKAMVSNSIPWG